MNFNSEALIRVKQLQDLLGSEEAALKLLDAIVEVKAVELDRPIKAKSDFSKAEMEAIAPLETYYAKDIIRTLNSLCKRLNINSPKRFEPEDPKVFQGNVERFFGATWCTLQGLDKQLEEQTTLTETGLKALCEVRRKLEQLLTECDRNYTPSDDVLKSDFLELYAANNLDNFLWVLNLKLARLEIYVNSFSRVAADDPSKGFLAALNLNWQSDPDVCSESFVTSHNLVNAFGGFHSDHVAKMITATIDPRYTFNLPNGMLGINSAGVFSFIFGQSKRAVNPPKHVQQLKHTIFEFLARNEAPKAAQCDCDRLKTELAKTREFYSLTMSYMLESV